jgi:hypothetical protein
VPHGFAEGFLQLNIYMPIRKKQDQRADCNDPGFTPVPGDQSCQYPDQARQKYRNKQGAHNRTWIHVNDIKDSQRRYGINCKKKRID